MPAHPGRSHVLGYALDRCLECGKPVPRKPQGAAEVMLLRPIGFPAGKENIWERAGRATKGLPTAPAEPQYDARRRAAGDDS